MPAEQLSDAQCTRLHELFGLAFELPADERAAFCARECGDDAALRRRLEALLDATPAADDGFLAESVLSVAPGPELAAGPIDQGAHGQPPSPDPERIGCYRILERLGEGGMGVVYLVEQGEPVRRRLALKVIKPGMDSARVIARFELEREALARMDHPGIARIHDGGATAEGRPYFVMELVTGEPMHEYCRARRLPMRARLELFCQVCDAVQHAHQKGVIHRDLKPSNVLVTEQHGEPHAVVIDFGIARAMADTGGDRTELTRQHEVLGTLEYMAPEQIDRGGAEIDSRADIYSLGVMLFELLTGERPFDRDTPVNLRTPRAPSTHVRRREVAARAADRQATDPRTLYRTLRGELDWITMKALEHDCARRYAAASELSGDVRRYLAHEPVLAGPPGAWYRVRTFVRRHRLRVAAAAFLAVVVSAGSAIAVFGLFEARAQRDEAAKLADKLGQQVRMLTEWVLRINLENGPLDRREMLDDAARVVDEGAFRQRPRDEIVFRKVLGEAYASLGQVDAANEQLGRAISLHDGIPRAADEATRLQESLMIIEALRAAVQPLVMAGRLDRAAATGKRALYAVVDLFYAQHPELAGMLAALISEAGSDKAADLAPVLLYAGQHLAVGDPRWLALGDFLVNCMQWELQAVVYSHDIREVTREWYEQVLTIYREKAGLAASNTRFLAAGNMRIQQLMETRQYAEILAEAPAVTASFRGVLPDHHSLRNHVARNHGLAMVELGDPAGLPLIADALAGYRTETPASLALLGCLCRAVPAYERFARDDRDGEAARLRAELVARFACTPDWGMRFDDVATVLGPAHAELIESMKNCMQRCRAARRFVPEVTELLARCQGLDLGASEAAALVAGLNLIGSRLASMLQPSRAALPLLEHCVRVCRSCPGTSTGILPQAQWNLALVQLETGAPEQALATARAGIGLCDGPQSAGWDGQFRSLVGRCLDRIGDPGAEAELRSGYLAVAESIGLLSFHTIRAHRWLQDHYRDHGRLSSSVELAHDRLTGLLRQSAPPEALHDAVWTIVRTPAGVGAAATSAVEAATKACFLEPDRFVYRMGLGAALLRAGDLLGSLEALREASRLCVETGTDDGATPVPALRAIVLARFGRKAEAEAELARAGSIPGSDLVAEAEAAVAGR